MRTPVLFSLLILCFACGGPSPENATTETPVSTIDVSKNTAYCFRNISPYKDGSSLRDVEEMYLRIVGDQVTGSFIWLPAEKDRRRGQLEGTNKDGVLSLRYVFFQEGQTSSVELTATLTEDAIKIQSPMPELGISEEIKRVSCK